MRAVKRSEGINTIPPSNHCSTGESNTLQRYEYIPLDFIKAQIIGVDIQTILNNPLLNFTREINEDTGEVNEYKPRLAVYQNMVFKVCYTGSIYISGSLHKYLNLGFHNYNDFSQMDFNNVIERLYRDFQIRPQNIRITQLEFGVNLTPKLNVDTVINQCFQQRSKKMEVVLHNDANYIQSKHDHYILKIYNKSRQYKLLTDILRIEVKQTNWTLYRRLGINTLHDFISYPKTIFVQCLINRWLEVVFYDPTNHIPERWHKYKNPLFWDELRETKNRKTFKYHLDRLKKLNNSSSGNIQDKIKKLIESKVHELQG